MAYAIQWLRSLVLIVLVYLTMVVYAIVYLPWALVSSEGAVAAAHRWCATVRWLCHHVAGLKTEIRGEVPTDEVVIAAKHQSFLDIILIYGAVPRGKFIMKRILLYSPIVGQYALRVGCVPVDRGKRAQAIKKMVSDVATGASKPGQLIIYPQGTRVAPGAIRPYKVGTAVLYQELKQDCVPVACNVGLFWPKRGIYRKQGTAVVEFLPRIPKGLSTGDFMARIEETVERESVRLMAEAGFDAPLAAPRAARPARTGK